MSDTKSNTTAEKLSFGRHLMLALGVGITIGITVGHVDLLARILAKNIEWFEIYLCFLLPAVVIGVFYTILALLVHIGFIATRSSVEASDIRAGYIASGICIVLLVTVFPLVHLLLYGDILLWDPERGNLNTGLFFLFIVMLLGVQARGIRILDFVKRVQKISILSVIISNYRFFLIFGVVSCLGYDLYQLSALPDQPVLIERKPTASERPNVIVITLDTVRAANVSHLGYAKETTPYLDKLAKESVVFEKAAAVTSWTLPSHASIMTGKYSFGHNAHEVHQKLDESQLTLAEVFFAQGYKTAGFIAGPYCKGKYGFRQGFQVYHDRLDFFEYRHTYDPLSIKRAIDFFSNDFRAALLQNDGERIAPEVRKDVRNWISRVGDEPYFLFVNFFDAHDPYNQGLEYRDRFTSRSLDDDALNEMVRSYYFDPVNRYRVRKIDPSTRDYLIAMYDTEIYFLDKQVELFLENLRRAGHLENTIVIITSDHGEEFFEHGGVMHKQTLFEEVIHVPLMVYYPEKFSGRRVSQRVSIVDIFPTLLEIMGEEMPGDIHGQSLLPLMGDNESQWQTRPVIAQRYARKEHGESYLQSLTSEKWKYVQVDPEQPRMPTALYNLHDDYGEQKNLIQGEASRVEEMNRELNDLTGYEKNKAR